MKRKGCTSGFTLVEVALFLALTGLLFIGIIAGTGNSIAQQRFYDSTQSFAEFLRSIYSQVSNPEGVGTGRSEEYAIYGKMISFGQHYGLTGEPISGDEQKIFVYDVVGAVKGTGTGSAANMLYEVGANVAVVAERDGSGTPIRMEVAGIAEAYEPRWGATIETTAVRSTNRPENSGPNANIYEGTILVVRHPVSGTINTLVSSAVIEVNEYVLSDHADTSIDKALRMLEEVLTLPRRNQTPPDDPYMGMNSYTVNDAFKVQEVNFCVNPGGMDEEAPLRWNIRLIDNARNASGVETIDRDDFKRLDGDSYNMCRNGLSED